MGIYFWIKPRVGDETENKVIYYQRDTKTVEYSFCFVRKDNSCEVTWLNLNYY
jgi:hypothetical protein